MRLKAALCPQKLEIRDDSAKHSGHAGAQPGGESHFHIEIVSGKFAGLSRIDCHRLVNDALGDLYKQGLHAVEIHARSHE